MKVWNFAHYWNFRVVCLLLNRGSLYHHPTLLYPPATFQKHLGKRDNLSFLRLSQGKNFKLSFFCMCLMCYKEGAFLGSSFDWRKKKIGALMALHYYLYYLYSVVFSFSFILRNNNNPAWVFSKLYCIMLYFK